MQDSLQNLTIEEILEKIREYGQRQKIPISILNISIRYLSHLPRALLLPMIRSGWLFVKFVQGKSYLLKWYYLFPSGKKLNVLTPSTIPNNITISLTTIPSRISYIPYVLGSLLRQTMRPHRIILYLDEKRFANQKLPFFLRLYRRHGVEIIYCEDLKPHTKYYHAMTAYPDAVIITVDDDIFYPKDLVESLYTSYRKYPYAVSCRRAHMMTFNNEGQLQPYNEWKGEYAQLIDTPSMFLFPTGMGGVLYPPHSLYHDTFQKSLIDELAGKADDVWLKFMEILAGTPVVLVKEYKPYQTINPKKLQAVALCKTNTFEGENDIQIQNCLKYYESRFEGGFYHALVTLEQKITNASEKQTQP